MRDLASISFLRVRALLRMDLRRLFHGKAFYIMTGIAVFIPVMMLTQMSGSNDLMSFIGSSGEATGTFGAGMSLSMLNVLTGILLTVYISREYSTGFIKNIITAHANKYDYILSKAVIAFLCNAAFMAVYLLTLFILGSVMGVPASIPSVLGLVLYILEKLLLSIPLSMVIIAINLVFRRRSGWSIVCICIAATGIITMSLQSVLQMLGLTPVAGLLNYTTTGASAFASVTPNPVSFLMIAMVTVVWTILWSLVCDALMNKRDVL